MYRNSLLFGLLFIGIILASGAPAEIDPETVAAAWLFDEGNGNVARDLSGNGNDGDIDGPKWVKGKFGEALEFDGTDDWVSIPHSKAFGFSDGTSFSITVYFKGTRVGGALVGKNYEDTSQTVPWYLLWDDGTRNGVTLYLRDEAGTSYPANSKSTIADDKWHFIVGVADASKGVNSIWIDGVKETETNFNKDSGYGTTEGVLHIGRHYDRYTTGIIDEVALFNVALSDDDIQSLMKDGLNKAALSVSPGGKLATAWGTIKSR